MTPMPAKACVDGFTCFTSVRRKAKKFLETVGTLFSNGSFNLSLPFVFTLFRFLHLPFKGFLISPAKNFEDSGSVD